MSEPFSQAYIDLCTQPEVADRLREEWEPKFGDWAIEKHSGDLLLIVGAREHSLDMVPMSWEGWEEGMIHTGLQKHLIPLFQPGQIIEMLEERGYKDWELFAWAGEGWEETDMLDEGYYYTVYTLDEDGDPALLNYFGPDRAIALLRAWLEVVDG